MNSSINDENVNNYNANVGTPLFSQPQNVQEQSYEPNVNVAPQADIPPELGQIENLPQGIQNIAPKATDIGNNQQLNIEPQSNDLLNNYEQTGNITPNSSTVTPVAPQAYQPEMQAQPVYQGAPVPGTVTPVAPQAYQPEMQAQPVYQGAPVPGTVTPVAPKAYQPEMQVQPVYGGTPNLDMGTNIGNQYDNYMPPAEPMVSLNPGTNINQLVNNGSQIDVSNQTMNTYNKDSYLVSREDIENNQNEQPPESEEASADNVSEDELMIDDDSEDTISEEGENPTVNEIKDKIEELKASGKNIDIEEFDFEEMYQLVIKIKK